MAIAGRYSVIRRLLAATLSLVLVLASIIGAYAHAAHGAHHDDHGVHVAHADGSEPIAVSKDAHAEDAPNTGAKHASCGDLVCHGGFAILTAQVDRHQPHRRSVAQIPRDDTKSGFSQSSLDRPPRRSVLV